MQRSVLKFSLKRKFENNHRYRSNGKVYQVAKIRQKVRYNLREYAALTFKLDRGRFKETLLIDRYNINHSINIDS